MKRKTAAAPQKERNSPNGSDAGRQMARRSEPIADPDLRETAPAIRHATLTDLDTLCRIENTCFGAEAFPRHVLRHLLAKARGTFLIAERNGQIAGYISVLLREKTRNARIYSIAVDPAYQGCGIARRLVEQARHFAAANNRTCLTLEVRCGNTPAIALYEGLGFRSMKRLRGYYHDADGWRMSLEI